jgi:hypothetical protein
MAKHHSAGVRITAFGMATALAPNLPDSCAAARAGITRMSKMNILSVGDCEALEHGPILGCSAQYIAPGFVGLAKALLLGKAALADRQSRRSLSDEGLCRTGIFLNMSDQFYADSSFDPRVEEDLRFPSTVWAEQCKQLIPSLLQGCNLEIVPENHRLYFGGHTGFVRAIQEAASMLLAGHFDRCLVGGIDSCIEARFLIAAATKRVLKTSMNPVGFVPGEAAAFILLERAGDTCRKGEAAGFLMGASFVLNGLDRLSDDPPDGVALARAIHEALPASHSSREALTAVVSDLNGDDHRARDWGHALTRLRAKHRLADVPVWIPALAFGEIGAASAPVGLCLGIVAQQRGWIPRGPIVAWFSADKGSRAALCFASTDGTH